MSVLKFLFASHFSLNATIVIRLYYGIDWTKTNLGVVYYNKQDKHFPITLIKPHNFQNQYTQYEDSS